MGVISVFANERKGYCAAKAIVIFVMRSSQQCLGGYRRALKNAMFDGLGVSLEEWWRIPIVSGRSLKLCGACFL